MVIKATAVIVFMSSPLSAAWLKTTIRQFRGPMGHARR
jgi:hypothetical protein